MLILYETPGGYALFKVLDEKKLNEPSEVFKHFQTPEDASNRY